MRILNIFEQKFGIDIRTGHCNERQERTILSEEHEGNNELSRHQIVKLLAFDKIKKLLLFNVYSLYS